MADNDIFRIGAGDLDAEAIVREIREKVKAKREQGLYADSSLARAERYNLDNLDDDEDFLDFYLEALRECATVDISDFPIVERRKGLGLLLKPVKKAIWGLLRFYTYRLWSQQNEVNGLLLSAIEASERRRREQARRLESRIAALEGIGKE